MTRTASAPAPVAAPRIRDVQLFENPPRLGDWELLREAGRGAYTAVYEARVAGGARREVRYAVKLARPDLSDQAVPVELLRCEAFVGRSVSHPNLAPVLAAQLVDVPHYLVMPWLAGSSLRQLLDVNGPLDAPTALWIVRQTAQALEALDAAGWVHRDVKPDNIMVSPAGHATLVDLAFACRHGAPSELSPAAGTPAYAAPEVLVSMLASDRRADIYSLGVVLFECLSGRLPYEGRAIGPLVTAHRTTEPADIRELAPTTPHSVAALVHDMLAKQPLRRPQSAREAIDRLFTLEVATFADRPWLGN